MTKKTLTQLQFIEKCIAVHKNKYDYSLAQYINQRTKLKIICREHGQYEQTPNSHLRGMGCPKCANHRGKYSKKEFVALCEKIHKKKYDYSKVEFKNLKCLITLECKDHGEFQVLAFKHKQGSGCQKCRGPIKKIKDKEKVIADFNLVHDNKYTYEKMIYKGSKIPIVATCSSHGDFYVVPNSHLAGTGCPRCTNRALTREQVITRFRNVHGLKYDYSKVIYVKSIIPVTIICRDHGPFEQMPDNHWSGTGCPICAREKTSEALKKRSLKSIIPLPQVIESFKEKHSNLYDYSLINDTNYKTLESIVPIRCNLHGVFNKQAQAHKKGRGCPECSKRLKDQSVLIEEFRAVHGNRYGYDRVVYKGYIKKVEITCVLHGSFFQTPASHLQGAGCSTCSKSHSQQNIIKVFKQKHGDRYGYDRVIYRGLDEKVEILCKKHGEYFWQTPSHHKRGSGCTKCSREKSLVTQAEIIKRFKAVHKDRYDYSSTVYTLAKNKLSITCRIHGEFWQLASDHVKGRGCPECAKLVISQKAKLRMKNRGFGRVLIKKEADLVGA